MPLIEAASDKPLDNVTPSWINTFFPSWRLSKHHKLRKVSRNRLSSSEGGRVKSENGNVTTRAEPGRGGQLAGMRFPIRTPVPFVSTPIESSILLARSYPLQEGGLNWSPTARVQRGESSTARCASTGDRSGCPSRPSGIFPFLHGISPQLSPSQQIINPITFTIITNCLY